MIYSLETNRHLIALQVDRQCMLIHLAKVG